MIKETIKHYSEKSKLSLLIRHGDRDKIPSGSFGNEILLNEKGIQNSLKFGESLASMKINKILTSPVGRCVQTAEFIAQGYGKSIEIIETTALGAPGLHINDGKVAGEFYLNVGFDEMYRRYLNEIEIPGIPPANEINQSITKFISENSIQNGLTIFVTHDMLIAFYHFSLNKTIYSKENWVKYLSGLILKNGNYEE
jgi:broad specificity phosphatase PhoE